MIIFLSVICLSFNSCLQSEDKPDLKDEYSLIYPEYFPDLLYNLESNPISEEGFKLGRRLFFDPILSSNQTISCGSCHLQGLAWADNPQHKFSVGVNDSLGIRNTPSLQNLGFIKEFVWDGGVNHLDFSANNAIQNNLEMNETIKNVVKKLNNSIEYPKLFKTVFGSSDITSAYMLKALSQFMLLMISDQSKFDFMLKGQITFTEEEDNGYSLFEKHCTSCHEGPLQSNYTFKNNGIDSVYNDIGRMRISESPLDLGKFRVPSLRNIELTRPYMHNGKFSSLEEVIEHYSTKIIQSETLAIELKSKTGFHFSTKEKRDIIMFLQTLTDSTFTHNPKFFIPKELL